MVAATTVSAAAMLTVISRLEQRRGQRHDEHRHDEHDGDGREQVGVAQQPLQAGAVHEAMLLRPGAEAPPAGPGRPASRDRPATR